MMKRALAAAAVGLLATLATTGPVTADELIPLNITNFKGEAGAATFTLGYDGDAGIELVRRSGYGGYGGRGYSGYGGYRGYYGGVGFGYGRGYSGGYYGGYGRSYYHRPYYAGYNGGYYGGYYPRSYYYPRAYISASFYRPYTGYYSTPSYYYDYYDPYCPLNGDSSYMPYSSPLGTSGNGVPLTQVPWRVPPMPRSDGTFRYDGGPASPVPLPGKVDPAPTSKPVQPAPAPNTRLVSIPNQPASGFAYPAYGQPRPTSFATDPRR